MEEMFTGLLGLVLCGLIIFYCICMILLPIFVYLIAKHTKHTKEYMGKILDIIAIESSNINRSKPLAIQKPPPINKNMPTKQIKKPILKDLGAKNSA